MSCPQHDSPPGFMQEMTNMNDNNPFRHGDHDWKNRKLCSDGNCIGVIGEDGLCKECGTPYEGEALAADDFFEDGDTTSATPDEASPNINDTDDSDWENRKLCSDGNCIGVIGKDGLCRECGKPYI